MRAFARLVVWPIEAVILFAFYVARVRFLRLTVPGRIGHLAMDPMTFVKRRKLGMLGWCYPILISPPSVGENQCLLKYWKRYIHVVQTPFWARILTRLTRFRCLQYDATILAINETAAHYVDVQRAWGTRPGLFELERRHRERGRAWLREHGVPDDAEIVCFHCREPGYSLRDDDINHYRNSDVENCVFAARELARRGFWCLRMGGPTQKPISGGERIIDYAHHPERSDWLDVFLCAECKFFIGASSGLIFVPHVFGKPLAAANQAPLSTVLAFGAHDVATPKLLWSEREGRPLTFPEAFGSEASNWRFDELYTKNGIRTVENTGEEILDLALEVLERAEGRAVYTREDEDRQRRFISLLRPGHFAYGGANRVGRAFLRKHEALLRD